MMSPGWKIIAVIVLVIIGFNLFLFAHVKRKIAAAKEEGYRRQAEADSIDV